MTIGDEKAKRIALTTVLAVHKPRIFNKGEDGNNSKIGSYKTNPISISKKNQARNTGKTYFKGGYAEYKKDIGKNPGFVNLRNKDQMMIDYGIVFNGSEFGFGFQNQENANKSGWMTDKYDKDIFVLSDQEVEILANVILAQIKKAF
jgi:hypothetical protein